MHLITATATETRFEFTEPTFVAFWTTADAFREKKRLQNPELKIKLFLP